MVYCDYPFFLELFLLPLSVALLSISTRASKMKFTFSRTWVLVIIVLGVTLDAASLFLPWGTLASSSIHVYLPGSVVHGEAVPLPISDFLIMMQARGQLITISNLIKATIITGWAGIFLYWRAERHVLSLMRRRVVSYSVILASSVLSFLAVAVLALTDIGLSWGAYLALFGGVFMMLAVVMKELKVEVVVEREVSEQEG